jgi:hypothetical protein
MQKVRGSNPLSSTEFFGSLFYFQNLTESLSALGVSAVVFRIVFAVEKCRSCVSQAPSGTFIVEDDVHGGRAPRPSAA